MKFPFLYSCAEMSRSLPNGGEKEFSSHHILFNFRSLCICVTG